MDGASAAVTGGSAGGLSWPVSPAAALAWAAAAANAAALFTAAALSAAGCSEGKLRMLTPCEEQPPAATLSRHNKTAGFIWLRQASSRQESSACPTLFAARRNSPHD